MVDVVKVVAHRPHSAGHASEYASLMIMFEWVQSDLSLHEDESASPLQSCVVVVVVVLVKVDVVVHALHIFGQLNERASPRIGSSQSSSVNFSQFRLSSRPEHDGKVVTVEVAVVVRVLSAVDDGVDVAVVVPVDVAVVLAHAAWP